MLAWCTRNGRRGNVLIVTSVTTPRKGAAPQSPRHCKRCSAELSSEGHDSSKGSPLPQTPRMRCSWSIANPCRLLKGPMPPVSTYPMPG